MITLSLARTAVLALLTAVLTAGCGSPTPPPAPVFTLPPQVGDVKVKTFGETFHWPAGLEATLSTPRVDNPSADTGVNVTSDRAARFTATFTNHGAKAINLVTTVAGTLCDQDKDMVFSSADGLHGAPTGKVLLPGKTIKFDLAWSLDATPCELQVQIRPTFGFGPAVWTGTIQ